MTFRLKILQKIAQVAEEVPTEPENVPTEPQAPVSQPPALQAAQPAKTENPMAAWKTLISKIPDISILMETFINKFKQYPEGMVDWAEMARDIEASKNIEAAQIFVAMMPQVDPTLVQRMQPEAQSEEELIEGFKKLITGRTRSRLTTQLIPELVSQYGSTLSNWGWLVDILLEALDFENLLLLCKSLPGKIDLNLVTLVMEHRAQPQQNFDFIRDVPMSEDHLDRLLKKINFRKDLETTPEDMLKVYVTQNANRDLYDLVVNQFIRTENPEFLKILLTYPPVAGYGNIIRKVIKAYEPPHVPLLETALGALGSALQPPAIKKNIEYTFSSDSCFPATICLFQFAKGKIDRGDEVLKHLNNLERGNFTAILNLFDQNELDFVVENFMDVEEYHSNQFTELFTHPKVNKTLLIGKVIKQESYAMALEILKSPQVGKNEIDTLLIQKFIEGSGDVSIIKRMLNDLEARNKKVNFAAGKKKYNDTLKKVRLNQPGDEEEFIMELEGDTDADRIPERMSFIQEAASKKDWFYLDKRTIESLFGLSIFRFYLTVKGKQGKDLYHEVKGDNILVLKCQAIKDNMHGFISEWRAIVNTEFGTQMINASTNFGQFVKLLEKSVQAADLKHQFGLDTLIAQKVILNPKIDLGDPSVKEFLELYKDIGQLNEDALKRQIDKIVSEKPDLIDAVAFDRNLQIFKLLKANFESGQSISLRKGSAEYEAFKNLHSQIALINQYETIRQYIEEAQPKVPELNLFNWTHPNGMQFSVLKYMDPYAFQVGADTECCQRIGGVGADAAIDSFINPLAGVLVVKNQGLIISQSYFHFVPETKGLILDNVEWNSKNASKFGIDEMILSKVYADFAVGIKAEHPEISYVLCGKSYNKINNFMFESSKIEEDPRSFAINEEDPYSDFDEDDHLDLLKPKADLSHIDTKIKQLVTAERTVNLISLATVRRMVLQRSAAL